MWTNTIGAVDPQAGSNSVIEASLNAPQFGGGRAARRAAAQEAVAQTGEEQRGHPCTRLPSLQRRRACMLSRRCQGQCIPFTHRHAGAACAGGFDSAVSSYEGLLSLARSQGAVGGQNRGACKRCGQLGHLTKQCRNFINLAQADEQAGAAALAPVLPPVAEGKGEDDSSDLSLSAATLTATAAAARARRSGGGGRRRRGSGSARRRRRRRPGRVSGKKHKKHHRKEKGSDHKKRRKASPDSD